MFRASLFAWLQGADFYRSVHRNAVDCLPPGDGRDWLDVGCGPGLVCRLAAARGYRATGIDVSPGMIRAARRLGRGPSPSARFGVGDVAGLAEASAHVVSAASLLVVLDDKAAALACLWKAVRPGGRLLVVEATPQMNRARAEAMIAGGGLGRRTQALRLWAAVRGGRTVDPGLYASVAAPAVRTVALLGGMVEARIFEKVV